jgi:hypothetical protein
MPFSTRKLIYENVAEPAILQNTQEASFLTSG